MKTKAFLICPVRNITDEYREAIEFQVRQLEIDGYEVYYPARDTNQGDCEYNICLENKLAMKNAKVVFVIWDGNSEGVLFDLGMAFAMGKRIRPVTGYFPRTRPGNKSFANLVWMWEDMVSVYA